MKQAILGVALAAALATAGGARADEQADRLQALVTKAAPSVVTVRAVLKTTVKAGGQSNESESRMEMQGVVVDDRGLVMISNVAFSPERMMGLMGRGGGGDFSTKTTPSSLKVVFEQEEKEYDAFLAATDTKLDLAFLQIEKLDGRKLSPADFSNAVTPTLGQSLATVTRMDKGYDYVPMFSLARVSGIVSKPRPAFAMTTGFSEFGMPVYTMEGAPVGVLTVVSSGAAENNEAGMFGMSMRFLTGGGFLRPFVVPAQAVSAVIAQARERAAKMAEDRAKNPPKPEVKPTAKPADKPKKP